MKVPEKTRWFFITFFWDSLDWAYHTKDTLPGDVFLPDKNGVLYIVTRDEPTLAHTSLGVEIALKGGQAAVLGVVQDKSELFAAQMKIAKFA